MRRISSLAIVLMAISMPVNTSAQPAISSEIAPTRKLRIAMNSGTPVLLMRTSDGKMTGGVALEVGKFIAEKLGVPFELVAYPNSTAYTQSFSSSDQFLSRNLKSAELVRSGSGSAAADGLCEGKADVYAASASNVYQVAERVAGAKIVRGAFTSDRYTVTLPKGQSSAAQGKISEIVKEAKPVWCERLSIRPA